MKLIVGLGNPGKEYSQTRHNLGFLAVDVLKSKSGVQSSWFRDRKFKSEILKINELKNMNCELVLVKPQTYVNKSGVAVSKIARFYKVKPENILVIRDDIDLPEGKIRGPKADTGSGGHLGIESIQKALKTNKFYQLKIGVGRPRHNLDPADWVLQKMSSKKWQEFEDLINKEVVMKIKNWLNE